MNPIKDFLTKSPLSAMMSLESRLPIPKVSSILFSLAAALPDVGPPREEPRSVEKVIPPLNPPRMTDVESPLPESAPEKAAPVAEKTRSVAELLFE